MAHQTMIAHYLAAVESEMRSLLQAPDPALHDLYGYLRYHLGWADRNLQPANEQSGKRLRPLFCLLCCEACGGEWQRALPAAAAVELVHNFSLIHDDIEDSDTTRRGRPTAWTLWGIPQTLNAGDALYALSQLALLRLERTGLPAEAIVDAARLLNETSLRLTEGQFLDIRFESRAQIDVEEYLAMIERKTGALLAAACELGALVAQAPPSQRDALRAFGLHLGLAFQIQDDILGIWGDPAVTGKPVGSDLIRRKKTLPILYGLAHSEALRALLDSATLTPADVEGATRELEAVGSRKICQDRAEEHTRQALAALDAAALRGDAALALRQLALSLLGRER